MPHIHPTAVVDAAATLADDVRIGPYCVIGPDVVLAEGVALESHVVLDGRTEVGPRAKFFPFSSIGLPPQDLKYRGEESRLVIGADTVVREHVTMNPGTEGGGLVTSIGERCLIMVGAHVAHDCRIGNDVILVNNATLAGHVTIEDHAILGGLCAVHQWVRVGAHAFVGGMSGVEHDVIPFGSVIGNRAHLGGLNIVGLKRHGFSRDQIHALRKAYRLLFADEGTLLERVDDVARTFEDEPLVQTIVEFIRSGSDRALCTPRTGQGL
ncbi:acyl-ACP--UDP-N-acetylglucosamine O-acyltransferase [Rhodobium gokarnense]|uniref:Acyl-[acyl-carrier-protein]--UDP-N-acetylglucosamine O-acyltransferase n=1 Tax=Rhodobium gokarnense TaxID=364296 RepID=A0ABT3HB88_9HYPH|nr:acyl-ACP--UDP-N-acetylglucosamine O-acyltransferase [Rhodobium gokarnense]MCW2307604.1 UDP-N-acetylglucosamine acyltransferase [Rhodobium gokarnense]